MAILSTFSGENKMQNLAILSNADNYNNDIQNFIASVEVTREITEPATTQNSGNTSAGENSSVVGIWTVYDRQTAGGFTGNIGTNTIGVFSHGYQFNNDGTYFYFNKIFLTGAAKISFAYETGKWSISGNQLTVTPIKGQQEEWSKKDGKTEAWGSRLSTAPRKSETITYTVSKKTSPVDKLTRLILQYGKETGRDGKYYDKSVQQWAYSPLDPDRYDLPPGYSMDKMNSSSAATPVQATSSATTSTVKYELWMAYKFKVGGGLAEKSFQCVVISSNNRCLFHFPEKGLFNLDQDYPASSDSWGTITDKGDKLVLNNNKYGKKELYKKTATAMGQYADSRPGDYYKKCRPVNGVRIEGAYSADVALYKNKATLLDKIMYDPDKRPIIFFKNDGTYINEGIAFNNITKGDDFAIGKGTYELKDFSLILTTKNGRQLQVAFAGIQDANPATGSDGFIINNNLFYKLDNSYQPH